MKHQKISVRQTPDGSWRALYGNRWVDEQSFGTALEAKDHALEFVDGPPAQPEPTA